MLEDVIVSCPICDKELHVKVIRQKRVIYIVPNNCPNCKTPANKIEKSLNYHSPTIRSEKSYMKLNLRTRD